MKQYLPENLRSLSSPIITSSMRSHLPNLTPSGLSNVDTISPPENAKENHLNVSQGYTYLGNETSDKEHTTTKKKNEGCVKIGQGGKEGIGFHAPSNCSGHIAIIGQSNTTTKLRFTRPRMAFGNWATQSWPSEYFRCNTLQGRQQKSIRKPS